MELGQVETFLAVATFGGFHRAAEALRVSQPAVSSRIRALEESLGVALFVRSRNSLTLSSAGRLLRPYAEQLLKTASIARQALHQLEPESDTPLQIAAGLSISVYFLPDVLEKFKQVFPMVGIDIRPGHSKEVLEMVLGEEAEIGLARSLQHPEVETITLRDDPLLLVGSPPQPTARSRRARLEEVAGWPLIFYERGSSDWTLTRSLFRHPGLLPNVALEVDTIETAKRMVERGLGLAFLPAMAVAPEIARGELATIKIIDAEPLHRSLDLIHPRHRPLRAQARSFLEVVRQIVRERPNSVARPPSGRRRKRRQASE
jgi:DNA-binding transcriptional LysR family regulator